MNNFYKELQKCLFLNFFLNFFIYAWIGMKFALNNEAKGF